MDSEKQSPASEGVKREADVYDLLAWFEVNRKKVGITAVALVALGFVVATARYLARQKEEKASAQLLALKPTLTPNTNAPPPQASGFLKLADDFKGTGAGERARMFAASTLFTEGRYAEAEKEFSRFVQEHPNSPWTAHAAYGVAASQEANNKSNEAFASYQTVVTAHAASPAAREAKLALARLYELRKQPDQALRLYNELTAPQPGGQMGEGGDEDAEARKEALLRLNPNLNTNLVAPAPAMPTLSMPVSTNAPAVPAAEAASQPAATATNAATNAAPNP